MSLDIIYLAFNRLKFTQRTFDLLLENTPWERVSRLLVFDDGSTDGTRQFLDNAITAVPVPFHLAHVGWRSPVATMNLYLDGDPAERFVKLDNDIAVPPGWLDALLDVADRYPHVELLGMEAGQTDVPDPEPWDGVYRIRPCSHIGGVGLMRSSAFLTRPRPRSAGRFGFDSWQHEHDVARAWVTPDLHVPQLDRIPAEPWLSLSDIYKKKLWQRPWGPYDASWQERYWSWMDKVPA